MEKTTAVKSVLAMRENSACTMHLARRERRSEKERERCRGSGESRAGPDRTPHPHRMVFVLPPSPERAVPCPGLGADTRGADEGRQELVVGDTTRVHHVRVCSQCPGTQNQSQKVTARM